MRFSICMFLFICHTILAFTDEYNMQSQYTESQRKEFFYSCSENNKDSCNLLIEDGVPSAGECSAKTTCMILARIYEIADKINESLPYYAKSCNAQILEACFNLALAYESLQQYADSKKEYEQSCHYGFMASCYNLAMLYVNGLGVPKDMKKANRFFMEACSNDDGWSCYSLATSYRNGEGFKPNRLKAQELFEKACKLGIQDGCKEFKILHSAEFSIIVPHIPNNKK